MQCDLLNGLLDNTIKLFSGQISIFQDSTDAISTLVICKNHPCVIQSKINTNVKEKSERWLELKIRKTLSKAFTKGTLVETLIDIMKIMYRQSYIESIYLFSYSLPHVTSV